MRKAKFVSPDGDTFSLALDGQNMVLDAKYLTSFCTFPSLSFFFGLGINFLGAVLVTPFTCRFYELPVPSSL